MKIPEDPVTDEVELKEVLNTNGKPELKYSSLVQETNSCSSHSRMSKSDEDEQNLENGLRQRETDYVKEARDSHFGIDRKAIAIAILAFGFIVSVSFNIIQHKKIKQLQTTPALPSDCPPNWFLNKGICYFFSDIERSWNDSQSNCSSYGGSLLTIHSQDEWAFILKHRRPTEYWVGLQRKDIDDPWKWPNGSLVDPWLYIGGKGLCAYLNERAASSTFCDNERYWICSKPISSTY